MTQPGLGWQSLAERPRDASGLAGRGPRPAVRRRAGISRSRGCRARSHRPGRLLRSLVTGVLGVVLIAGILPAPAFAAPSHDRTAPAATREPVSPETASATPHEPADPPSAEAAAGQRPSSMYEAWSTTRTTGSSSRRAGGSRSVSGRARAMRGRSAARRRSPSPRASSRARRWPGRRTARECRPAGGRSRRPAARRSRHPPPRRCSRPSTPRRTSSRSRHARSRSSGRRPGRRSISPAASGLRRQVFGFLPYWEVTGAASRLDYDVLSTIAYFSVGVTTNGTLKKRNGTGTLTTGWGGWTSSEHDPRHQRGPRRRHPGRPHGHRVRLDDEPGQGPAGDPRQQRRPARRSRARSRRPCATAAPTG